jgi:hypothetical protein
MFFKLLFELAEIEKAVLGDLIHIAIFVVQNQLFKIIEPRLSNAFTVTFK